MISLAAEPRASQAQNSALNSGAPCCPRSGIEGLPFPSQSIRTQLTVNVLAALVPPPGTGVVTVTLNVPALAMSAALIVAVISVELTYVVARGDPAQSTTELLMNPVPLTVRVNPAPPWVALGGESDVMVGLGFTAMSCTVCVPAESLMVSVPVWAPRTLGVNFTVMVHSHPALRLVPQFWVAVKSPVPLAVVMLLIVSVLLWSLVRTTVSDLLAPTVALPKFRLSGETLTGCVLFGITVTKLIKLATAKSSSFSTAMSGVPLPLKSATTAAWLVAPT